VLWESHRQDEGWSDLNAFHYVTLQKIRGEKHQSAQSVGLAYSVNILNIQGLTEIVFQICFQMFPQYLFC